jgi:hypothetical protein
MDERPLPGRSKKVRIDNPKSTDLSELDFNFSNSLNNNNVYDVIEKKILTPAEISKNLHDDVVAKQKMIERLINEADEYALHIKEGGQMIVQLRKSNDLIRDEIEDIKLEYDEVKKRADTLRKKKLKEQFTLTGNAATEKRINDLIVLIKEQRIATEKIIRQTDIMEGEIAKGITKDDAVQMKKLEKAQSIKKLYIERLEQETKDYEAYRNGVKNNEKLIHRLEKKLYSNTGGNIKSVRVIGGVSHFKEANQDGLVLPKQKDGSVRSPRPPQQLSNNTMKATDKAKIIYLEKEKDDLLIRNKALHLYASGASNAFIGSNMGNDPRDRRLAALQQQLLANAKTFAQQISNLKLELMELEIRQGKGNVEDKEQY